MNRKLTNVLTVAALGGLLVAGTALAAPLIPGKTRFGDVGPAAPADKTQAQAKAAPAGDRVSVLVHMQAGADRGPVRGFAAAQGGHVKYEYDILPNVMNLRGIPQGALNALAATPGVVRWEWDGEVHAHMNDSAPLIRALQSQINGAGLSADGSGIRVCIIDTGIDSDSAMYASRIDTAAGRDFVNNDNDPEDDAGHGSHVAGTAVGGDTLTVDFGCVGSEPFAGIAPQATLIGIKVLGASGSGSFSDVIAGINYGADQTASGGRCDVINMSLGGGQFVGTCDTESAAAAANNAVDAGVVVVSSSGNDGFNNAMGTPACGSKVIAVGLTFDDDYPNCEFPSQSSFGWCFNPPGCTSSCTDVSPSVDEVSCMSNASTQLDVTAPGCITFSADKDNSPNGIVGQCGTSMASPHVAGLAALLLSADGSLTPAEVRQHIRDGAIDLGPAGFDNAYGWGRIDAINSLSLLGPGCSIPADCDDSDACTTDDCVGGSCSNTPITCDDGVFCNGAETCDTGLGCQAGTPPSCDDGVGCTDDSCNVGTDSCDNIPNDANCPDDGQFCNGAESCDAVSDCVSSGDPCTGGDVCNEATDTCDPSTCNSNGTCDAGEDCDNCPADCISGTSSGAICGNNICEAGDGENCVSCAADCKGKQNGKPSGRFCCCGDGGGESPVPCSDSACTGSGNTCTDVPTGGGAGYCCGDTFCEGDEDSSNCAVDCGAPAFCGDASCDPGEDACNCSTDCGAPPATETNCSDGIDEDCDGGADCNDPTGECDGDPSCSCGGNKASCSVNGDCCSGNCKNGSCKGN